ncbi:MAG: DUF4845 domain-containing protein [Gammaproteobacteria bacterium]|nr:DUF4845 domain-containing protein [Gammaproteobacteria bacterium]
MKSMQRQRGASFLLWLVLIGILGFGMVVGFKLFPVYLNGYAVEKILNEVAQDSRGKGYNNKKIIWQSISKRLDVNSISDVTYDNLTFKRESGNSTVDIDYEVRKHLFANIDAVIVFKFSETFKT